MEFECVAQSAFSVAMKLPLVPNRSKRVVEGKFDKGPVPLTPLPKVNVEHENGVAAVVDERNCEAGKRDPPRLIESDSGDRLTREEKIFSAFFISSSYEITAIDANRLGLVRRLLGFGEDVAPPAAPPGPVPADPPPIIVVPNMLDRRDNVLFIIEICARDMFCGWRVV